ncbi:MAG: tetratricopeptide repeat protein [Acidobacteriota bacterium]|nr:tetratricopeptide repeat protein [Acidobacteriota bacterium]
MGLTEIDETTPLPGGYGRDDVRRIADVTERQLRTWERQGLLEPQDSFGFSDLLALKTLKKLRQLHITPRQIQRAITSLKSRLDGIDRPLAQLRITAEGRRITVHVAGDKMEPISGQLLLNFDAKEIERLRSFPVQPVSTPSAEEAKERLAEHWFQRGLALEETGAPIEEAAAAYRKAIESNPNASGALVNLGTIAFRMRRMKEAAVFYERAMQADPAYPLAHFNLGNLHDERGDFEAARKHYLEAIRLNPRYADAYFNLALLCERNNELLQAIGYWNAYLKLDSSSTWAGTARKQLERLKRAVRSK